MQRRAAVLGALSVVATLGLGCGESGTAMESGGLTSGGAGGMFASGGIGGATGGASGAAGVSGMGSTGGGSGGSAGVGAAGAGGSGGVIAATGGAGGSMATGGSGGGATGGTGGDMASGGMGGATGGMGGAPGGMGGTGGVMLDGDCCDDGDCICREAPPSSLSSRNGPYEYDTYELTTGTVYYPTDAEPPFAAVAICPGFLNSGPEMAPWGPFYASHGIVMIATWTLGSDIPDIRAIKLLDAVKELAAENTKAGSPLMGKLAGRYGTSGYSMGGGGTTIAASTDMTLRTSVGLAAWGPVGANVTVATLFLCGESDNVAACSQSSTAYRSMPETTPKMLLTIPLATHFSWFGPQDAGSGASGARALAFQKVFLEGDERWRPLLTESGGGTLTTNID